MRRQRIPHALIALSLAALLLCGHVASGSTHAERELARKLIKLMLAAAVFSPPGLGLFPMPLPLPIPFGVETIKPPILQGPFGPIPFLGGGLTEEFHNYFALPVTKDQLKQMPLLGNNLVIGLPSNQLASSSSYSSNSNDQQSRPNFSNLMQSSDMDSSKQLSLATATSIQSIIKAQQEQSRRAIG